VAQRVIAVQHAVLADRLSVMRDRSTPHAVFRQAVYEASAIMAVEVLRDEIAVVPVLRAGLGMVEGFLRLLPDARVGHLGIQRDHEDHAPVDYFERLPPGLPDVPVYLLDPMLATGGSAVRALHHLKRAGARHLELVCLVAAPEGLAALEAEHPDVPVWTAAIDRELDNNAYIRPGLGDAGDRVFGTS
jgi:uracil phosphoribosyltransferase